MTTSRNPMKDRVAIAGAATTGFTAKNTERSQASYAIEACVKVLRECGLRASDIDGIVGSTPDAPTIQAALGIPVHASGTCCDAQQGDVKHASRNFR
jgi:3-oxoacyl-[acyl-carrier-protein] synthase III